MQRITRHALAPQAHFAQTRSHTHHRRSSRARPARTARALGEGLLLRPRGIRVPRASLHPRPQPRRKPKPTAKDSVRGHNEWTLTQTPLNWSAYRGDGLGADFDHLADLCWPFHDHVIQTLHPKAILCLGKKAGNYVRRRLGAHTPLATFIEDNNRHWKSHSFAAATGTKVIVATHPSIADWTNPATDPTGLVIEALS